MSKMVVAGQPFIGLPLLVIVQAAQSLISSNASVHAKDNSEQTPVHVAAIFGSNTVLKLLLDNNASSSFNSVSAVDKYNNTPLHLACAEGGDLETVTILLQKAEDIKNLVSAVNENQQTPIHLAAKKGKNNVLNRLLENSSSIYDSVSAVDHHKL